MNITQELAQRMLDAIEKVRRDSPRHMRSEDALTMRVLVRYHLPNRRQWWKTYGEQAKTLGLRGPNPLEAAKRLTPEMVKPVWKMIPDEPLREAYREAIRRGLVDSGVRIGESHWLRKIASGEMPPENNLV